MQPSWRQTGSTEPGAPHPSQGNEFHATPYNGDFQQQHVSYTHGYTSSDNAVSWTTPTSTFVADVGSVAPFGAPGHSTFSTHGWNHGQQSATVNHSHYTGMPALPLSQNQMQSQQQFAQSYMAMNATQNEFHRSWSAGDNMNLEYRTDTSTYDSANRVHTPERPTPFRLEVSTPAVQRASLIRRTSEAPYKCDLCHNTFTTQANLRSHRDSHEGNKPHICHYEFCGKAFVRKHDLTRHIKGKHTDDRPFECDTCHKTYSRKDELNQHLLRAHRA